MILRRNFKSFLIVIPLLQLGVAGADTVVEGEKDSHHEHNSEKSKHHKKSTSKHHSDHDIVDTEDVDALNQNTKKTESESESNTKHESDKAQEVPSESVAPHADPNHPVHDQAVHTTQLDPVDTTDTDVDDIEPLQQYLPTYVNKVMHDIQNRVRVYVNKVWPSGNPQETYRYYDFPLGCQPDLVYPQLMSLGQILKGDRLLSSNYDFEQIPKRLRTSESSTSSTTDYVFESHKKVICDRYLGPAQLALLKDAIDRYMVAELYVDDFPVTTFIGLRLESDVAQMYMDGEKSSSSTSTSTGSEANDPEDPEDSDQSYIAERMWSEYQGGMWQDRRMLKEKGSTEKSDKESEKEKEPNEDESENDESSDGDSETDKKESAGKKKKSRRGKEGKSESESDKDTKESDKDKDSEDKEEDSLDSDISDSNDSNDEKEVTKRRLPPGPRKGMGKGKLAKAKNTESKDNVNDEKGEKDGKESSKDSKDKDKESGKEDDKKDGKEKESPKKDEDTYDDMDDEDEFDKHSYTTRNPDIPIVYHYFLMTHYDFEITHTAGDIRRVKIKNPSLKQMLNITDFVDYMQSPSMVKSAAATNTDSSTSADGTVPTSTNNYYDTRHKALKNKFLKATFSYSVHWLSNVPDYPESREQAIAAQIEENDYHLWHDMNPEVDDEKEGSKWDWLSLPDDPKHRMKVHWMGIGNAFGIMFFIFIVLVGYISRSLHYDFRDLTNSALNGVLPMNDLELKSFNTANSQDQSGWKLLHADVFRAPRHRMIFCSMVGSGVQLMVMMISVILIGCYSNYHHRGSVMSTMAYFYVLSSVIGGYVSGNWYQRLYGDHWSLNMLLTTVIFVGPAFLIWSLLNTIAIFYNSTAAFPFSYILFLLAGWICLTIPLTVVGATIGRQIALRDLRKSETKSYFPCRTNKLERRIPNYGGGGGTSSSSGFSDSDQSIDGPGGVGNVVTGCIRSKYIQYMFCGCIPFMSIYVEIHYIFDSVWGLARYTVYGILLLAVLLTLANSSLITILFLYFQLNSENHKWWWRSFFSGFSIGGIFMLYCTFFYFTTAMDSFLQTSFFFLYSGLSAYGIALILGSFTFLTSMCFMDYIYSHVKSD